MGNIPNTLDDTNVVLPLFEASNITSSKHFPKFSNYEGMNVVTQLLHVL